jgi:hypothetical protein
VVTKPNRQGENEAAEMIFLRPTAGYTLLDKKENSWAFLILRTNYAI